MTRARLLGLVALTAALALESAAAELVVVTAKGVELKAGQAVDGAKPLKLEAGQLVTLISSDGRTIKLKGPYEDAPAPGQAQQGGDVVDALKNLVGQRGAGSGTLGVVRSASAEIELPEPWIIDVSRPGTRCWREGGDAVFWRADAAGAADLEIQPADRSWQANARWPDGINRLKMPPSLPLRDGQSYVVTLGGGSAAIVVHSVPATLGQDAQRLAWLVEKGCEAQAVALLKVIEGK
jgi:hypothetical protein